MAAKSYEELNRDLKNKIYSPIYLLQGDEPYYLDKITDFIEKEVLGEMEKEFNQTVIYGRDCDVLSLVSTAKRYPMMSNYQVVIVKEAQDMKTVFSNKTSENDVNSLLNYIQHPLSSTLLVFCLKYKSLDKRGKLYKALEKSGVVFESKKIYENKVPDWIENYLADLGQKIQPKAAQLMAEYLGADLSRVANECDKLLINLKKGEIIDTQQIETNIGISKEFNIFELQEAIGLKNIEKANRIINYFGSNTKNNPFPVTIATLYSYFSKLLVYHSLPDKSRPMVASALKVNPFFIDNYEKAARNYPPVKLASVISILREGDLKFKGVNSPNIAEGEILKEVIYKILH